VVAIRSDNLAVADRMTLIIYPKTSVTPKTSAKKRVNPTPNLEYQARAWS
jgi:hypothetical protein